MSDVTQGNSKPKREGIAERLWVDADGNETTNEKATGFTYVWKGADKYGGAVPEGQRRKFTYQFGEDPGSTLVMHAIFGGITRAGNIANTWANLPENERGADPIDDIAAVFEFCDKNGLWGEERAGGVGTRFDKEKLAQALEQFDAGKQNRPASYFQAKLDAGEKVLPKGEKREILYGTYALRNDEVKRHYTALVPAANAPGASDL